MNLEYCPIFNDRGWRKFDTAFNHSSDCNRFVRYTELFTVEMLDICWCTYKEMCFTHKFCLGVMVGVDGLDIKKYINVFKYFQDTFQLGFCSCYSFVALYELSKSGISDINCPVHKYVLAAGYKDIFSELLSFNTNNLDKYLELIKYEKEEVI